MLVTRDVGDRVVSLRQRLAEPGQFAVLSRLEAVAFQTFEPMPTESSLQLSRLRQLDRPACQARWSQETNCTSSPSRRIRKWLETRVRAWPGSRDGHPSRAGCRTIARSRDRRTVRAAG